MIVAAALAMLVAVVPTPAVETLVVTSVDASACPQVAVDFVLPERFAAVEVTPAMVTVDGTPAAAVVPIDPTSVVARITDTVGTPGEHVLALTVNGETIQAVVTVSPPTPELASSPPVPSAPTVAEGEVPNDAGANTTPTTVKAVARTDATAPPDNHSSPLAAIAIVLIVLLIAIAAGYIVLGRRRKPHADAAGTDEESHIRAAVRARLAELLAAPAAAEPAAPAVAEPVETPGAHSYKVIESESMQLTNEFLGFRFFGAARDATPNVVPDPESGRMTELEIPPESEPLAEFVSHEPAPQSEPVPLPAPEPESKQVAEFVSHEHEPAPQSEPVHAPESEREPEPEPASATDPDPVAPRLNALSTPAYVTRGGGRSEPKPVRVAAEPSADPAWLVSGFLRFCPASGEVWSGRMQVHLDPQEVAILQLLMTSGNRGVTRDDIITAGSLDPSGRDFAPLLARIKRKTGWRGQMVRRESVTVYVFDDDVEIDHEKSVGRRPARPPARR